MSTCVSLVAALYQSPPLPTLAAAVTSSDQRQVPGETWRNTMATVIPVQLVTMATVVMDFVGGIGMTQIQ